MDSFFWRSMPKNQCWSERGSDSLSRKGCVPEKNCLCVQVTVWDTCILNVIAESVLGTQRICGMSDTSPQCAERALSWQRRKHPVLCSMQFCKDLSKQRREYLVQFFSRWLWSAPLWLFCSKLHLHSAERTQKVHPFHYKQLFRYTRKVIGYTNPYY